MSERTPVVANENQNNAVKEAMYKEALTKDE